MPNCAVSFSGAGPGPEFDCKREALEDDDKCILHSEDPEKDEERFEEALEEHREEREGDFRGMIFPMEVDFGDATFEEANFRAATFNGEVSFKRAFGTGEEIRFDKADFSGCEFGGDVLFTGESEENRAFAGGEVDFEDVTVAPDANLHFRYADLSQCRFLRTDLQVVDFTGVKWCREFTVGDWLGDWLSIDWFRGKGTFDRIGLYDEVVESRKRRSFGDILRATIERMGSSDGPHWTLFEVEEESKERKEGRWREVERLYRQLKRNYEERGDFPRGGDFHIGEKEARRKSSRTFRPTKFLLYAYRALSKYGERALPATFWLLLVVLACAGAYASHPGTEGYFEALRLSTQATFFPVKPIELEGPGVRWVNLFQRVVSPLILFLLALALRQRVKR